MNELPKTFHFILWKKPKLFRLTEVSQFRCFFDHKLPGFLPYRRRFSSQITSLGVPFIALKLCIVKLLLLFLSYDQAVPNIMNVKNMKMNKSTLRKFQGGPELSILNFEVSYLNTLHILWLERWLSG